MEGPKSAYMRVRRGRELEKGNSQRREKRDVKAVGGTREWMGTRERRSRAQTIARHAGPTTPSQSIRPLLITGTLLRSIPVLLEDESSVRGLPDQQSHARLFFPMAHAAAALYVRCTAQELPGPILQVRPSHHIMSPPSSANNRLVSAQLRRGLAHIYGAVPRRDDGASDPQPFCICLSSSVTRPLPTALCAATASTCSPSRPRRWPSAVHVKRAPGVAGPSDGALEHGIWAAGREQTWVEEAHRPVNGDGWRRAQQGSPRDNISVEEQRPRALVSVVFVVVAVAPTEPEKWPYV
ncbi:hypothetical protein PMIN01_05797 [Paraphaeosphaeria minitans]|uniref:Uncharacterized protein n=1 Tax=Paraphaeosphaeria minitans TaxID=565426 RepID=A0A9P6GHU3_9PLEO|nr:hypothetical protein PMIN01_05797 [Paraphaeosphaeria minitans]